MAESELEELEGVRPSAPITGFIDYDPQKQYLFNLWLKRVFAVYERFGFNPLHLKPVERLSALQGEGDTQKQIFEIFRADTGKTTGLGLPFDHTVPLALWVAEHAGHLMSLPLPYKRYDIGLSYRGERPKTGRFRAFVQADVDIIGRKLSVSADAECLAAIAEALTSLEIGSFKIRVNHIAIVKSLLNREKIPEEKHATILRLIDKLDKLSVKEVASEIEKIEGLALSSATVEALLQHFTTDLSLFDPNLEERYGLDATPAIEQLRALLTLLKTMGVDPELFVFAPGMVRGLAYYTGMVFETLLVGKEQYGSVAGGGRYSNLVGSFSPQAQDIEGVGGTLGLTRLFDILCKTHLSLPQKTSFAHVLVGARTEELLQQAYELGRRLRSKGLRVDLYSGQCKIKHILGHANALGVPYTALIMDNNAFVIKEMHTQSQSEFASMSEAVVFLGEVDSHWY